jgi:transposase, IS5 family
VHEKSTEPFKNRAPNMIKYRSNRQLSFTDFTLPFSGSLDGNNRWVRLANLLPWDKLVSIYATGLSDSLGRGTKDLRIELGTLIIQEMMDYTDREVIAQIQENPYLQYFLGYEEYRYRQVFDPSLLVTIRKRLAREAIVEMTRLVAECRKSMEENICKDKRNRSGPSGGEGDKDNEESCESNQEPTVEQSPEDSSDAGSHDNQVKSITHQGELIIDATAVELEIPYPTDLGLLNEARLQSERIIDVLWSVSSHKTKKPRTYRQKAKAAYLSVAKKRHRSRKIIRKGIKQQLQYLRRNLKTINKLRSKLSPHLLKLILKRRDRKLIETIGLVYSQQRRMYKEKSRRIDHRIVNLYQPWIRPIKRGKSGSDVEFGPKLSVSLVDGVAYVDHFSWEAFNEGTHLKQQVEAYRERHGFYPEAVISDQIYGTRENRRYLKSRGIRYSGKKLGRPVQITAENREELAKEKKRRKSEQLRRNYIEGCFGVGRRRYGLGQVRTRLEETSETTICMAFFAMSIAAYLAACFVSFMKLWWRRQMPYRGIIGRIVSKCQPLRPGRMAINMA